jgi:GNAT superfamily N-acetyltransferase
MPSTASVTLSQLDHARFGVITAKASGVSTDSLPRLTDFCLSHSVRLLIARVSVTDLECVQAMEAEGFRLMDTLVYYERSLSGPPPIDDSGVSIRPARREESGAVGALAREAFRGYSGHYHTDPRLDKALCDEAYSDWAARSCLEQSDSSAVLVAEADARLIGLATLRLNSPLEGEGVLFGVRPEARRRGVFASLLVASLSWCVNRGARQMLYSTQINNAAAQRVLGRGGFIHNRAYYTLHKWFD